MVQLKMLDYLIDSSKNRKFDDSEEGIANRFNKGFDIIILDSFL